MEMEKSGIKMAIAIRDNSRMAKDMVREYSSKPTVINLMENINTMNWMELPT